MGAGKSQNVWEKIRAKKSQEGAFLTFFSPEFFLTRFDFFPPPLIAPGSPRMGKMQTEGKIKYYFVEYVSHKGPN